MRITFDAETFAQAINLINMIDPEREHKKTTIQVLENFFKGMSHDAIYRHFTVMYKYPEITNYNEYRKVFSDERKGRSKPKVTANAADFSQKLLDFAQVLKNRGLTLLVVPSAYMDLSYENARELLKKYGLI